MGIKSLGAAALAGVMLSGAAYAGGAHRTVSEYAANPTLMLRVLQVCKNDPGDNLHNLDCINAEQAQADAYIAEMRRKGPDLTSPESPKYWRDRPMERAHQMWVCSYLKPEHRHASFCDVAG